MVFEDRVAHEQRRRDEQHREFNDKSDAAPIMRIGDLRRTRHCATRTETIATRDRPFACQNVEDRPFNAVTPVTA